MTQAELAEKVGTKQPAIARIENGTTEPKISNLRRLAEALDAELVVTIIPS